MLDELEKETQEERMWPGLVVMPRAAVADLKMKALDRADQSQRHTGRTAGAPSTALQVCPIGGRLVV